MQILETLATLVKSTKRQYGPYTIADVGHDDEMVVLEVTVKTEDSAIPIKICMWPSKDGRTVQIISALPYSTLVLSKDEIMAAVNVVQQRIFNNGGFCYLTYGGTNSTRDITWIQVHSTVYFPLSEGMQNNESVQTLLEMLLGLYFDHHGKAANTFLLQLSSAQMHTVNSSTRIS